MKIKHMKIMLALLVVFPLLCGTALAKQGDKKYTTSGVSIFLNSGGVGDAHGIIANAHPMEPNGQHVVYSINACGTYAAAGTCHIDLYQRSSVTPAVATLTAPWCGGTTTFMPVDSNGIRNASGVSFYVLDDGAGLCGWGEDGMSRFTNAATTTGDWFEIDAGASNFACGDPNYGLGDISGVTFPKGSKLYPMEYVGGFYLSDGAYHKYESNSGIFAIERNSPLLWVVQSVNESDAGVSVFSVTSGIER